MCKTSDKQDMISVMFDLDPITLPEPLDQLSQADLTKVLLQRGEQLFLQNDPTLGIYYLVDGVVTLTRVSESGRMIVLHRARAGETFAEASMFSDHYHCTAIATRDSKVIRCHLGAVDRLFHNDPEFVQALARRFALDVQQSRRQIERLSIPVAEERIIAALEDGLLGEDISEFAMLIGLAPETVYRALARLTRNGQVQKLGRGRYQVLKSDG